MRFNLHGYTGSGLITVDGGTLSLRAEGPEELNPATQTYQGVTGTIAGQDVAVYCTLGQPRPYKDRSSVPNQYLNNGRLAIINTITPGTYPMGTQATPGPRGEVADLILNLVGPQLYVTNLGTLTIAESTRIRTQSNQSLYRLRGTFQALMYADGVGISASGRNPTLTGSFDLLLLKD